MMNLKLLVATARDAARAGAEIISEGAKQNFQVEHKGTYDLVTRIDKDSENRVKSIITGQFPDHTIYAEESDVIDNKSEFEWFIDPLDGTTNFVHRYPSYAISIGVHYRGKPIVGIVIECSHGDEFSAVAGHGSFRNGERLRVSTTKALEHSLLVTGFDYEHGACWKMNMDLHRHFTNITQGVRRLGAAAIDLCHVATGQVDGFWEFNLNPWDSSAGVLIVQEAGGLITGMDGSEHSVFNNNIVAANPSIHSEILKELSRYNIKPLLK